MTQLEFEVEEEEKIAVMFFYPSTLDIISSVFSCGEEMIGKIFYLSVSSH